MPSVFERREFIRQEIERRGLKIHEIGKRCVRVTGHGVDLVAADLIAIELKDLQPARLGVFRLAGR